MNSAHDDIAIVGMSALFAGAPDLETYWQNIVDGVDAVREAPDSWSHPYYDPASESNDRMYTRKGGFIADIAEFNPMDFGIMPSSIDGGDPDGYIALKLARDALQDAGYLDREFNRSKTGVILGRGLYMNRGQTSLLQHGLVVDQTMDLLRNLVPDLDDARAETLRASLKASLPPFTPEMASGLVPNAVTGRIANRLDLMGPNYVVDGACASSLLAVEQGIQELQRGRCDMVLAGGVHTSTHQPIFMFFCQLGALSRSDVRPFDKNANGTLIGEGVGIVVLKRLEDARADDDRIYAIVKGIGSSSDGQAKGVMAPRLEGEVLALRRAYEYSGISPDSIELLEAHGTGIPLGDQTEIKALTEVFGLRSGALPRCALGSIKSMVSHCLPAAGAAGLIKTALALYHKVLPPTLCGEPNPSLEMERTPFYVNNVARPWIHGPGEIPRRAGVDSFGFGGINSHAILEEYVDERRPDVVHRHWASELVVLGGDTREALIASLDAVRERCAEAPAPALVDLAEDSANRVHGAQRLAIVAHSIDDLVRKLERARARITDPEVHEFHTRGGVIFSDSARQSGKVAFVFPGEGAQYPNMLVDVALCFPSVRKWFDLLDETSRARGDLPHSALIFPAPTCLTSEQREEAERQLHDMGVGSESVSIANLALFELLADFGIHADMMVGHSTGEFTGLVASGVAGAMHTGQVFQCMAELGQVTRSVEEAGGLEKGALLAVGAISREALDTLLAEFTDGVHLAMDNCHNQTVLFATEDRIEPALEKLKSSGAIVMRLPFDRAYHTPLFQEVAAALATFYKSLEFRAPRVPLYSCASAAPFPCASDEIRELAASQWARTVRFRDTIARMHDDGAEIFVEVGPRNNLTSFIREILSDREHVAVSCNEPQRPGLAHLQQLLGSLFVRNVNLDLTRLYRDRPVADRAGGEGAGAKPKRGMTLNLELPVMRSTNPDAHLDLRPRVASENPSGDRTAPAQAESYQPAKLPREAGLAEPSASFHGDVALVTSHVADSRLAVLESHFDLMREFLASQSRVMESVQANLLGAAGSPTPATAPHGSAPFAADPGTSSSNLHAAAGNGAEQPSRDAHPLLGTVLEHSSEKLVVERTFDLQQDRFLQDHVIGVTGRVSERRRDLHGLAVLPLTVNMEMAAEAAHWLAGGSKRVTAMFDVHGHRWVDLAAETATVRIVASRDGRGSKLDVVAVKIYRVDGRGASAAAPVFEASVELADIRDPSPSARLLDEAVMVQPMISDEQLYRTGMFHGPRMQGVKHLRRVGADGVTADLEVLAVDDLFDFTTSPLFAIDPILLDLGAQLIGYWTYHNMEPGANVFPERIERFEQYVDSLEPGTRLVGHALIQQDGGGRAVRADIDMVDQAGRVVVRLVGWWDRIFQGAEHVYHWRIAPQNSFLSEPWKEVDPRTIARRLTPSHTQALEGNGNIWLKVVAHAVLAPGERKTWYRLPEEGGSREKWLFGRVAAKDAVRQWARELHGVHLAPVDVEIGSSGSGEQFVDCPYLGDAALPKVSISHTVEHCVARIVSAPAVQPDVEARRLDPASGTVVSADREDPHVREHDSGLGGCQSSAAVAPTPRLVHEGRAAGARLGDSQRE